MKKITRGLAAAGAAVVLLTGTGGTLAYWNDTVAVGDGAVISAGRLALAQDTAPAWTIAHANGSSTPVADLADVRVVPGDRLVFAADYTITAQGRNLVIEVAVAGGSIEPVDPAEPADVKLADRLADTATFMIDGVPGATGTISHRDDVTGTYAVTLGVELDWAFGDAISVGEDNPAMNGQVDLSGFAVTATQVAA